jgi:hypothetical protein
MEASNGIALSLMQTIIGFGGERYDY